MVDGRNPAPVAMYEMYETPVNDGSCSPYQLVSRISSINSIFAQKKWITLDSSNLIVDDIFKNVYSTAL